MAKPPDEAKLVFSQGVRFWIAETVLGRAAHDDRNLRRLVEIPAMVISSFASECFLKCLGLLDGKPPVRGHNLFTLFQRLDEETKEGIRREWAVMIAATQEERKQLETRFGVTLPTDIEASLRDCGDAFQLLRYIHERPKGATFYITHLPKVLHDYTIKRTGWDFSEKSASDKQD